MSLPSLRSQSVGKMSARAVYALNKALNTSVKKKQVSPKKILPSLKKASLEKTLEAKRGRGRPKKDSTMKKDTKVPKKNSKIKKKQKRIVKHKAQKDVNSSSEADCSSEGEDESDQNADSENENLADLAQNKASPKNIKQKGVEKKSVTHRVKDDITVVDNESDEQNSDINDENGDEHYEDVSIDDEESEYTKNAAHFQKQKRSDMDERAKAMKKKNRLSKSFIQNQINVHKMKNDSVKEKQRYPMEERIGRKHKLSPNGFPSNQNLKKRKLENVGYNFSNFMDSPIDPNNSRGFRKNFQFGADVQMLNQSLTPNASPSLHNTLSAFSNRNKSVPCGNIASYEIFSWLIYPMTPQYFFKEIFEKTAYHIKKHKTDYFTELFCCDDISTILRKNVLQYGVHLDVVKYSKGERIPIQAEGRAYNSNIWEDYANGFSIRLRNPHAYNKKLANVCSLLQEYFSSTVGVNVYLTPPKAQGFPPHYDDIDAFIVQVEGSKHWRIYKPRNSAENLARYPSKDFSSEEIGLPFMEVFLKAGDVIYIPRGYIHQAATGSFEHSMHLTFSTNQLNTWGDFMCLVWQNALDKAIINTEEMREALPKDYPNYVGFSVQDSNYSFEYQMFIEKIKKFGQVIQAYLGDTDAVNTAADIHFANFISKSLPPSLTLMEKRHSLHKSGSSFKNGRVKLKLDITSDTEIQLIRKRGIRLIVDEEGPKLYHNFENPIDPPTDNVEGTCIDFDSEGVPAFIYLYKRFPEFVKVGNLPFKSLEEKLSFALSLYENGVLMTKKPLSNFNNEF